ncbi:hypothetical protein [Devosia sp. Leaf64]|uniref:hypothetical protein n=1 Tax=Devosia sp. Leaf64 TaxID=1736229 RepID=UPI00071354E6|nr:hypothetical protein [Devosia sp. Leaf64]KQN75062.1 hypothetical protein ASE94_01715 [Devosia sp. Leaf64]
MAATFNGLLYLIFGYALGVFPALISALLLVWRRRASVLEAVIITIATTVSLSFLAQPTRHDFSPLAIASDAGKLGIFILPGILCAGLTAH